VKALQSEANVAAASIKGSIATPRGQLAPAPLGGRSWFVPCPYISGKAVDKFCGRVLQAAW